MHSIGLLQLKTTDSIHCQVQAPFTVKEIWVTFLEPTRKFIKDNAASMI